MTHLHLAAAALILVGVLALAWQLTPQGARGSGAPIVILGLISLSNLLLTPLFVALLAQVRVNSAYLMSHLFGLIATALTVLYWGDYLSAASWPRRRMLTTITVFGFVIALLIALFATSPQQDDGLGFGREFSGSPRMQLYWLVQSVVMMYAMSTLAGLAARARAREYRWRRALLSILTAVAVVFAVYEAWVVVVAVRWPAMPPLWAQHITSLFQVAGTALLVVGTIGPALTGVFCSTRVAMSYIGELAPLHDWLTQRYPQVRFRRSLRGRPETRVIDMLIEISDALRLLQRDSPTVAADYRLDHNTIWTHAQASPRYAAYELTAARLFVARPIGRDARRRTCARRWIADFFFVKSDG